MNMKKLSIAFAVSALSLSFGMIGEAQAATYTCDGGLDYVDFGPDGSGMGLQFGCITGSTVRHMNSYTASDVCTAQNVSTDVMKGWLAMAQAALLSGRQLVVYYTSCGGRNRIDFVSMRKN